MRSLGLSVPRLLERQFSSQALATLSVELIFDPPSPIQNMVVIMPVFQGYVIFVFRLKLVKIKSEDGLVVRLGDEKLPAAEEVRLTTDDGSALA